MKKLIIINGVMGVIGSPLFTYFAEQGEHIIYGISRRGLGFETYLNTGNKLPETHLVFSLGDYKAENYETVIENFINALPDLPVVFIHTIGEYITEMTKYGELEITNDYDGDGINDDVKHLTYEIPISFSKRLSVRRTSTTFVQLGSLSDKYRIDIHGSWVKSMDMLKVGLKKICKGNKKFKGLILNVSSVLTPKELIDRPFVSVKTNADMRYWLPPAEIAHCINQCLQSQKTGFIEKELYRKWPAISLDHFNPTSYKVRRGKELYGDFSLF